MVLKLNRKFKILILRLLFAWIIISLITCDKNDISQPENQENSIVHITVLYTNDEHGWMLPDGTYGGAAGMMYQWKEKEGYDGTDNYLILSGGDMWSGPSISTWFQGKSMAEVMRAMDYDAAAIGNHEFDFTVDHLKDRLSEQSFPLLAANIFEKSTHTLPDFAQAYIIKEIEGVKVGIIGLASLSTPTTTFPTNVEDYEFTNYTTALEINAKAAKNDGATILIAIGHICSGEMNDLVAVAKANGICIIGGGHCHQQYLEMNNDVVLIQAGSNMRAYGKVEFDYYTQDKTTANFKYKLVDNLLEGTDDNVQSVVDYWQNETDKELSEEIAYTDNSIGQSSTAMRNMVCDSWLFDFPNADVALTNGGGIRQSIPEGAITLGTIVGLLPFENEILELELTGQQLKEMAQKNDIYMGGMTTINGFYLSDGTPINDANTYTVLTTDYLYLRNDFNFSTYDPNPVYTKTHYREPLIDWLRIINTSAADPLPNYLDHEPRK